MEILGIGTDIIEIERVARSVEDNPRFSAKVFTKAELDYCSGKRSCHPHLAGRFAAKEAVAKAIGQSLSWQDVEILNGVHGKPDVRLSGRAAELTKGCRVMLSLSHSRDYATATAILVKL
jgi:holo-[acyl-carrier protein] synthase